MPCGAHAWESDKATSLCECECLHTHVPLAACSPIHRQAARASKRQQEDDQGSDPIEVSDDDDEEDDQGAARKRRAPAAAAAKRALPIATARPQRQGRRPAIVEVSESEGDEEPEAHSDEESDFVAEEGAEDDEMAEEEAGSSGDGSDADGSEEEDGSLDDEDVDDGKTAGQRKGRAAPKPVKRSKRAVGSSDEDGEEDSEEEDEEEADSEEDGEGPAKPAAAVAKKAVRGVIEKILRRDAESGKFLVKFKGKQGIRPIDSGAAVSGSKRDIWLG